MYQTTLLYRELKLRSSVVAASQLKLLPREQLYSNINGIWNLSSDQGNLGTFIVTNVRVIWYADINETFNISLPYMQIATVRSYMHECSVAARCGVDRFDHPLLAFSSLIARSKYGTLNTGRHW